MIEFNKNGKSMHARVGDADAYVWFDDEADSWCWMGVGRNLIQRVGCGRCPTSANAEAEVIMWIRDNGGERE